MKKVLAYLLSIALATTILTACGKNSDENEITELLPETQTMDANEKYMAVKLDIPHDEIYGEDILENQLYYLSKENGKSVLCRIDLDNPGTPEVKLLDLPAEQVMLSLDAGNDGILNILAFQYENADSMEVFVEAFWHRIDTDGKIIKTTFIGEAIKECAYYWATAFKVDGVGNAYLAISNDAFLIKPDGNLASKLTCGVYISGFFKDIDGNVYVRYSQGQERLIAVIDFETQSLESSHEVISLDDIIGFGANVGESFAVANVSGAHIYNINDKSLTTRFTWLSINVAVNYSDRVIPLLDNRLLLVNRASSTDIGLPRTFSLIRQMTAEDIALAEEAKAERERLRAEEKAQAIENMDASAIIPTGVGNITIGTAFYFLPDDIKQAIVEFNQENPDSRIEVIEYYTGDGDAGYKAAVERLSTDIATGNSPDILLLSPDDPLWTYAQKGALQDLYPYLAYEPSFNWDDYQEHIIKAYEIDSKLYTIPIAFYVETLVGKASDLEGMREWNIDELIAFADRFPESRIFHQPTKTAVLNLMLRANGEHMIDWASNGTGFDRALFIKMLEFANRFVDDDKYTANQTVQERIADGDLKIMQSGFNLMGVQSDMAIFGDLTSNIGFPSEQGSGFLITSYVTIAISAKCENNETAWSFIKHLLSDEFQSNRELFGQPIKTSSLEKRIENDSKMIGSIGASGGDLEYYSVDLRDATDEEIKLFREIVINASKVRIHDTQIDSIIMEEAGAYFSGGKTAEQVADIVENRVGIYVKEIK